MSFLTRLREAWSVLHCSGAPFFVEDGSHADHTFATGGPDIRSPDGQKLLGHKCSSHHKYCGSCPRRQAYWELLPPDELWPENTHVPVRVQTIESYLRDREREAAQVDDLDKEHLLAFQILGGGNRDLKAHPVLNPVAPGVEGAKHGTEDGERGGDELGGAGLHPRTVARSRGRP